MGNLRAFVRGKMWNEWKICFSLSFSGSKAFVIIIRQKLNWNLFAKLKPIWLNSKFFQNSSFFCWFESFFFWIQIFFAELKALLSSNLFCWIESFAEFKSFLLNWKLCWIQIYFAELKALLNSNLFCWIENFAEFKSNLLDWSSVFSQKHLNLNIIPPFDLKYCFHFLQ